MTDIPERIALRWEPGAAVTNGPLMTHPDYTRYIREDVAREQKERVHEQGWNAGWDAAMKSRRNDAAHPRVKPLEWMLIEHGYQAGQWHAESPTGLMRIVKTITPKGKYHEVTRLGGQLHDMLEGAQAAAQADYEARILSALVLP